MIFMHLSQFVAVWLIRKAHFVVLQAATVPSTLNEEILNMRIISTLFTMWP